MKPIRKAWDPKVWASLRPFGIGLQRPNNYWELIRALLENRDRIPFAWRILTKGVCDGCALGTTGMSDWTLPGTHLCNVRLRLLRLNTAPAFNPRLLRDLKGLAGKRSAELRDLGRLPAPMRRRRGAPGFERISWEEALATIAAKIRGLASPDRIGFYLTSRGMPNESYYGAQKAARAIGTNNIDNAARICHSPSTTALKRSTGVAATTCSYADWLVSDLIVFIGSNVANNQPVATKYIHYARKNGARVAVVNSYREPGMERYWIPSIPESSLFGTRISDRFFLINQGSDVAFLNGALKHLLANDWIDHDFIREHTHGFDALRESVERMSWEEIEAQCGVPRMEIQAFGNMLAEARRGVLVWSMGVTQHETGVANVQAIINLGLARGWLGREGCGLMPIRGHSGVQGGAEMGCYSTVFPGGRSINAENAAWLAEQWGFPVPDRPGLTAPEMIEAAHRGELDVLFSSGGNFLEVLPEPDYVEEALRRIPLRVHMDIVLTSQMLIDSAEETILLPAMTRYEIPGGVTETSTERRVIFSPEIDGPRVPQARSEWDVLLELARRVRPELVDRLRVAGTPGLREEIARVIPAYDGIQHLRRQGDQFQYGGEHLCPGGICPTPDGRARFFPVELPDARLPEGVFVVASRRGKQFNSLIHEEKDMITGLGREAVLINPADARKLGLQEGERVEVRNGKGKLTGRVRLAPIKPGNLQVHWPEGNVLLDHHRRSCEAGVPDYYARVTLHRLNGQAAPRPQPVPAERGVPAP